ncbi:hypothetical protein BT63DRAFT_416327 [Microthyrium microscopicum]|uniref:Uncharacterized protein n=1 Tax=Microthyrium microscopicum TaxID=703497 RepID=A0A6A6U436_9PEZI|nr:hypothetical protein BT63DRAFT_416327 [Microthyrium microscopicum]
MANRKQSHGSQKAPKPSAIESWFNKLLKKGKKPIERDHTQTLEWKHLTLEIKILILEYAINNPSLPTNNPTRTLQDHIGGNNYHKCTIQEPTSNERILSLVSKEFQSLTKRYITESPKTRNRTPLTYRAKWSYDLGRFAHLSFTHLPRTLVRNSRRTEHDDLVISCEVPLWDHIAQEAYFELIHQANTSHYANRYAEKCRIAFPKPRVLLPSTTRHVWFRPSRTPAPPWPAAASTPASLVPEELEGLMLRTVLDMVTLLHNRFLRQDNRFANIIVRVPYYEYVGGARELFTQYLMLDAGGQEWDRSDLTDFVCEKVIFEFRNCDVVRTVAGPGREASYEVVEHELASD